MKATYALSEAQLADMDSKLDYLIDAAGRLGRKDWLLMVYGAMFNFLVVAALRSDAARGIFQMLISSVAHLFGGGFRSLGG